LYERQGEIQSRRECHRLEVSDDAAAWHLDIYQDVVYCVYYFAELSEWAA
jgi:hypothetical protein